MNTAEARSHSLVAPLPSSFGIQSKVRRSGDKRCWESIPKDVLRESGSTFFPLESGNLLRLGLLRELRGEGGHGLRRSVRHGYLMALFSRNLSSPCLRSIAL